MFYHHHGHYYTLSYIYFRYGCMRRDRINAVAEDYGTASDEIQHCFTMKLYHLQNNENPLSMAYLTLSSTNDAFWGALCPLCFHDMLQWNILMRPIHVRVGEWGHDKFPWWLVSCTVPSDYLDYHGITIVKLPSRNQCQWYVNQNTTTLMHVNECIFVDVHWFKADLPSPVVTWCFMHHKHCISLFHNALYFTMLFTIKECDGNIFATQEPWF